MSDDKGKAPADKLERFPGEQDAMVLNFVSTSDCAALLSPIDESPIAISFILTTARVVALPVSPDLNPIQVPIAMLESWVGGKEGNFFTLELNTKHVWSFKFGFRRDVEAVSAKRALDSLKATKLSQLAAFDLGNGRLKDLSPEENFGWNMYDEDEELERQLTLRPGSERLDATDPAAGVGKDLRPWYRATNLGQADNTFGTIPTYPLKIVEPTSCSDEFLSTCLGGRSRGRIPAISYVHLGTGACLARSSQPLTFKSKQQRADDANLLLYLSNPYTAASAQPRITETPQASPQRLQSPTRRQSSWVPPPSLNDEPPEDTSSPAGSPPNRQRPETESMTSNPSFTRGRPNIARTIQVQDLRPMAAATGNMAAGGGYESGAFYEHCKVSFAGIDNIHGVTASWTKLRQLIVSHSGRNYKSDFYKEWDETKWIDHIQKILVASSRMAEFLDKGESVLAHCTDGWDRTSQTTSIAMLLLDPFYRTIHGFGILIEKEFCSFGHKFAERCNHMLTGTVFCAPDNVVATDVDPNGTPKIQVSPIFVQWLDCVYQVVRQFPSYFEFTPKLLEFLNENVYSCFYGTFLTNTAKERLFEGIRLNTISIWTEVERLVAMERNGERRLSIVNPMYDSKTAAKYIRKEVNCGIQRLQPSVSSKRLVFWEEFYLKHDGDCFKLAMPKHQWPQDVVEDGTFEVPARVKQNEVTILHDEVVEKAKQRRLAEIRFTEDLLPRLQVQRPTQAPTTGDGSVVVRPQPEKSKECRRCRDKFGWFNSAQHCQQCFQAFCSKCLRCGPPTYQKLCDSCYTFQEVEAPPSD